MRTRMFSVAGFAKELGVGVDNVRRLMRNNKKIFKDMPKVKGSYRIEFERWAPVFKKLLTNPADSDKSVELPPVQSTNIDDEAPTNEHSDVITYGESRATRELYSARSAKLDYLRRSGKLIEVDAVKKAWQNIAISVQKAVLAVPDRVAPLCVNEGDLTTIRNRMRSELLYALKNLSFSIQSDNLVSTEEVTNGPQGATLVAKMNRKGAGRKKKGADL